MDVLTSETCWALNNEIKKQVTSSWSLFNQLRENKNVYTHVNTQFNTVTYLWQQPKLPKSRDALINEEVTFTETEYHKPRRISELYIYTSSLNAKYYAQKHRINPHTADRIVSIDQILRWQLIATRSSTEISKYRRNCTSADRFPVDIKLSISNWDRRNRNESDFGARI
jgi:hypothetical protein